MEHLLPVHPDHPMGTGMAGTVVPFLLYTERQLGRVGPEGSALVCKKGLLPSGEFFTEAGVGLPGQDFSWSAPPRIGRLVHQRVDNAPVLPE